MSLTEEVGFILFTFDLERSDVDALETLLEWLETFREWKQHQDALEGFKQILGLCILSSQLNSEIDEPGRFDQLNKTSKGD